MTLRIISEGSVARFISAIEIEQLQLGDITLLSIVNIEGMSDSLKGLRGKRF